MIFLVPRAFKVMLMLYCNLLIVQQHSVWKTNMHESEKKRKLLSHVQLFATPWTIQSMEFSRPEDWIGLPFPSPGDLPNPGIEPRSPELQADSLPVESYLNQKVLYCWYKWTSSQSKNRVKDVGSKLMVTGGGVGRRKNWEIGIDIDIVLYIK